MTVHTNTKVLYVPDEIIYPGETLLEALEERSMSQVEFAKRINRHPKTINEIIKGKAPITSEMAFQFEQVLDIPASFWNSLESNHREMVVRIEAKIKHKKLINEARKYPYNAMAKNGWVKDVRSPVERVENLLSFFGTTSFENIFEKSAFRISEKQNYSLHAMTAWLRWGTLEGMKIKTKEFNKKELTQSLYALRLLTNEENANNLMPQIKEILAESGVAFVVTKNLPNAPISGATRPLSSSKMLAQLSIRYSVNDRFWFSLFHEIGHILLGSKRDFTVDFEKTKPEKEIEKMVNKFAEDILIPSKPYMKFVSYLKIESSYSDFYQSTKQFAHQVGVHPGIVLGRLQNDKIISPSMNKLKIYFKWV